MSQLVYLFDVCLWNETLPHMIQFSIEVSKPNMSLDLFSTLLVFASVTRSEFLVGSQNGLSKYVTHCLLILATHEGILTFTYRFGSSSLSIPRYCYHKHLIAIITNNKEYNRY